jgi:hypothetical protein
VAPRPDRSGLRDRQYGDPNVYLIDQGLRRWIPARQVMARLFTPGAGGVPWVCANGLRAMAGGAARPAGRGSTDNGG